MNIRILHKLIRVIACHIICVNLGAGLIAQKNNEKPNILFIMSDQHNANALGCYGSDIVR